jgi:hypothetical protein
MNSFGKIIEILILVILLFIMPMKNSIEKKDDVIQTTVATYTAYFTDAIRNKGYLDQDMYEEFIKWLESSGYLYQIKMTHYKKIYYMDESGQGFDMDYEYVASDAIVDELYQEDERYNFFKGDFIVVNVTSKCKTSSQNISKRFLGTDVDGGVYVNYGGVIRDEVK